MALDIGSAVGYLLLDASGWTRGISSAQQALNTFLDSSSTVSDKMSALGSAMKGVGTGLTTTVTTPLVGLGTAAVKTAANFEQAMAQVAAVSGLDKSSQAFQDLTDKAKEMGATTKFSASEAAEAFNYMAMAGWDAEQMMGGIGGIMDLAAASGENLATTSDIVTDAMTAFGLSAEESGHFADVLAAASNSANTNVAMLGESFKYVAPVAGALNFTIEDTSVALGLMANSGIKASQAGTSLRSLMTNLARPAGAAADAIEVLGLSLTDTTGQVKPLDDIMVELRDTFGDLTEAEKAQYAAMLAGQEGMSGLLAIVNASETDFAKLTKNINDAGGTAQKMADTQLDTLEGKITILQSALEGLSISFGEVLLPMLTDLVKGITGVVDKFNSLDDSTKESIVRFAAIAAAIGPVLIILGNVVSMISKIGTAFSTISNVVGGFTGAISSSSSAAAGLGSAIAGIAGPVLLVVAAVAALVASFKQLWDTNEEFRNSITKIWGSIQEEFGKFVEKIQEKLEELKPIFEAFGEFLSMVWQGFTEVIAPVFIGAFESISIVLETIFDQIINILDVFIGIFTGDWDRAWSGLSGVVETSLNFVVNFLNNLVGTIGNVVNVILGWFGTSWQSIWEGAKSAVMGFVDNIVGGFNSVVSWFASLPQSISSAIGSAISSVADFATEVYNSLVTGAENAVNGAIEWFLELPEKIAYAIGFAIGYITTWAENVKATLEAAISKLIEDVGRWFSELPGRIEEWLQKTLDSIVQWGQNTMKALQDWWNNLVNSIKDWFTSLPDRFTEWLSQTIQPIIDWGVSLIDAVNQALESFVQGISDWLSGIPAAFEEWFTQALDWLLTLPDKLYEIGANMLNSLWEGMKSIVSNITDWIGGVVDNIVNAFTGGVSEGMNKAKSNAEEVSGSYATGLDYVPRDMKVQVHEGERIMTKQENEEYSRGGNQGFNGPEILNFNLSIPMDGEVVAKKTYTYSVREGVLRGDDLVEQGVVQ